MAANDREIRGLIQEHEAIRAHLGLFDDALSRLSAELASSTGKHDQKEYLLGYRYALNDLYDGVRRHIDVDERVFKMLSTGTLLDGLRREHEEIKRQIDRAVQIASSAPEDETNQEELKQRCSEISEAFRAIRALIEAHMANENTLLNLKRKDG